MSSSSKERHNLEYTSLDEVASIARQSWISFSKGECKDLSFRKKQLLALRRLVMENQLAIMNACRSDLRKPETESLMTEMISVTSEIDYLMSNLDELAATETKFPDLMNAFNGKLMIRKEPKGPALIIGPWNYPWMLVLIPLAGAISAGCTAVIKPSEVAPNSAKLISQLIPAYLDQNYYQVVNGAVDETSVLLSHKWGHIFYTGNGTIGRIVMAAAAKTLTPVTLELGGKSPAIVCKDSDLEVVATRIAWAKCINAGQTCIAVDYVLCFEEIKDQFISHLKKAIAKFYPEGVQKSSSYGRIVNHRHFQRLVKLLSETKGNIVYGGENDEDDLLISPSIVSNLNEDDVLLKDEIFGPILPVLSTSSIEDAVEFINKRDHPLAAYVFSNNQRECDFVLNNTLSGGVCLNDAIVHVACPALPFGGVGESGMGSYHGRKSFDTFTHERSVLSKSQGMEFINKIRYPPYSNETRDLLSKFQEMPTPFANPRFARWSLRLLLSSILVAIGFATGRISSN